MTLAPEIWKRASADDIQDNSYALFFSSQVLKMSSSLCKLDKVHLK